MGPVTRTAGFGTTLLLAAVFAAACEGDGTTDTPETGTVVARVLLDGAGESDVMVRLYEGSATMAMATATTGSDGRASFTGLAAGSYEAEVAVPTDLELGAGEASRKAVTAVAGASREVTFDLVTPAGGGSVVEITAAGTSFTPADVTIEPGTTVRWIFGGGQPHTVTPDGHSEWAEASLAASGDTFEHTFNSVGDFPYFCVPHRNAGMTGSITVQ